MSRSSCSMSSSVRIDGAATVQRDMIDLVLRGDTVITPHGVGAYDIHVADGKIAAVTVPRDPLPDGARLIDATGKIMMPGGIDPHVHCAWPIPVPDGPPGL